MRAMPKKPGRPKAKESDLRVRVDQAQKRAISLAAASKGLDTSAYVRMAALERAKADGFEA